MDVPLALPAAPSTQVAPAADGSAADGSAMPPPPVKPVAQVLAIAPPSAAVAQTTPVPQAMPPQADALTAEPAPTADSLTSDDPVKTDELGEEAAPAIDTDGAAAVKPLVGAGPITTEFPVLSDATVQMPRQRDGEPNPESRSAIAALNERTVNLPRSPSIRTARRRRRAFTTFLRNVDRRTLPPVGRAIANLGRRPVLRRSIASIVAIGSIALLVLAVYTATRPTASDGAGPPGVLVGVRAGDSVGAYVKSRNDALAAAATERPPAGGPVDRYALVSLSADLTPKQFAAEFRRLKVVRVFMHAGGSYDVVQADVAADETDIESVMQRVARQRRTDANDLTRLLTLLKEGGALTPDETAVQSRYTDEQEADQMEIAKYGYPSSCRCVFAAIVHAPIADLERLQSSGHVRVVDVVPMATGFDSDHFSPLPPGQKNSDIAAPPPLVDAPTD
ncbi:MAG TPA: hypothetical protein VH442_17790 [Micromonosporaceae bacterium]